MADVFTQTGEELFADIIDGTTAAPTWYIDWGTGGSGAAKGDTALGTAGGESRVAATMSQPSADQNRFVATITASGAKTIIECGIFNATSSGIMIQRSDFTGIVLATNDKIEFTITGTHY